MKEKYFSLMEKALSAYSSEHINRYFSDVKRNGLTEHGFPRLTANIGILIANGRRKDLIPVFVEMMEFCCRTIPSVKAANDFSVREIVCCLHEFKRSGVVDRETIARWEGYLRSIDPSATYTCFAQTATDHVRNWALYTAASEFFRQNEGLCDSKDFIDLQLLQQSRWLDENGMYRDADVYPPMNYDLVSRGLFSLIFDRGYKGKYYQAIDEKLKKAGLLTLKMQSSAGEIPFGGRSNQFVFNEGWMAVIFEYEAKRYAKAGDIGLASRFKSAAERALAVTEKWLSKEPIRHIKNRYPTETGYGCEDYAYFDKYMITVASFLYAAYSVCDDAIPFTLMEDHDPCVAFTSSQFSKLFLKCGGYGLEFDLYADPHYDANGLGRLQRENAPSCICMSCPCPQDPEYTVDIEEPFALSLSSVLPDHGEWILGSGKGCTYTVIDTESGSDRVSATLVCRFDEERFTEETYTVSEEGVLAEVKGTGEIGLALPALAFDGEKHTEIIKGESSLTIRYEGWICRYTTSGTITDINRTAANRNGHYKMFVAFAQNSLKVKIEILPS